MNKILFFISFLMIFDLICISASITDTDEIILFREKARQIIDAVSKKEFSNSNSLKIDADYKMHTIQIITYFTEALDFLEKKEFSSVNKKLDEIEKVITKMSSDDNRLIIMEKNIYYLPENRLKVYIKIKNDSKKILEDYSFKLHLYNKNGNKIQSGIFYLKDQVFKPGEEISQNCFFYNMSDPSDARRVEIEL